MPGTILKKVPGTSPDDQQRTATPAEAVKAGADYLVVGRPIVEDLDPVQAAKKILQELQSL